jgi:hypothetical protein
MNQIDAIQKRIEDALGTEIRVSRAEVNDIIQELEDFLAKELRAFSVEVKRELGTLRAELKQFKADLLKQEAARSKMNMSQTPMILGPYKNQLVTPEAQAKLLSCSLGHLTRMRKRRMIPYVELGKKGQDRGRHAIRYNPEQVERAIQKLTIRERI